MNNHAIKEYLKTLGNSKALVDMFYPVGTIYETYVESFNPNEAWGGTWTKVADSIVADVTKRVVNGTINRVRGYSASITAPSVNGYEFDHWGDYGTEGWVSALYPEYALSQTTNIWNTTTDGSGYGAFHIFAYYVKRETVYRWERTA